MCAAHIRLPSTIVRSLSLFLERRATRFTFARLCGTNNCRTARALGLYMTATFSLYLAVLVELP